MIRWLMALYRGVDGIMTTTSVTLIQRVRDHSDQDAWRRFVSLYTPVLHRWTHLVGLATHDAADLIQDVFVILMHELPDFHYDSARGSFRGWLKTITLNKCRERQRRRGETAQGGNSHAWEALPAEATSDAFWETEYRERLVVRALEIMRDRFEPATWQACWETTVNDRSAREVALSLGLSEGAVYVAKLRVLRRLRTELAGLLD